MVRKKLLAALFAIVILAAAWYCFSQLYQADRTRAGTMVQVEHPLRTEPPVGEQHAPQAENQAWEQTV